MFDPDDIPLSTSEGRRPSSTASDRMVVGLAALALIGGLLIAAGRLLPEQPEQTGLASATPRPSAADVSGGPQPSSEPRSLRTLIVDPNVPAITPPRPYIGDWVRLRTRVTLLSGPTTSAHPSGELRSGDAAFVAQAPPDEGGAEGWLRVETPEVGWIFGEIDNEAMFERFPYRGISTSTIDGLTASPSGFTASGWSPEGDGEMLLTSADGLDWRSSILPPSFWGRVVAHGPAGWVMVGSLGGGEEPVTVIWQSIAGLTWEPLGALPELVAGTVVALAGSDAGYVMISSPTSIGAFVWFSGDGQLWTERPVLSIRGDQGGMRLAATPLGFYAWSVAEPDGETIGAYSSDGWTWSEAAVLGRGQVVDVVAEGDHLLALGRSPGGSRMWRGAIDGGQVAWSAENASEFSDAVPSRLISDGDQAIVLGWDAYTEAAVWWQRDGAQSWARGKMPAGFEGLPQLAAGGPQGFVTVDQADWVVGRPPVFWHLEESGRWTPEASPVLPRSPALSRRDCGRLPKDILALTTMDGSMAAECFGHRPITVRGWSIACIGCDGGATGTWKPAWLGNPANDRVIHLSPAESSEWGGLDGILHPSYRQELPAVSHWVEITGHFDDPEATTCRWKPPMTELQWYTGTDDIVAGCRGRFVVTAIREVSGP